MVRNEERKRRRNGRRRGKQNFYDFMKRKNIL